MGNYKIIQVNEETHSLLKVYANKNGQSIKGLIHKLITDKIGHTPKPNNVLRVK